MYDGGLFCTLVWDNNLPTDKKYPPGTRVECINPQQRCFLVGTIMDIPFPDNLLLYSTPLYSILFDKGTTMSIPLLEMASSSQSPQLMSLLLILKIHFYLLSFVST